MNKVQFTLRMKGGDRGEGKRGGGEERYFKQARNVMAALDINLNSESLERTIAVNISLVNKTTLVF